MTASVVKVAVPAPLNRLFDYLPPEQATLQPGQRVTVPFGRRTQTGIVISLANQTDVPADKLRPVQLQLDTEPVFDAAMLKLLNWAANYYRHPPGEVFAAALPAALRKGAAPEIQPEYEWTITAAGREVNLLALAAKAGVQARLLEHLIEHGATPEDGLRKLNDNWRKVMQNLAEKDWVVRSKINITSETTDTEAGPKLTNAQQEVIDAVDPDSFQCYLLQGVTGSGKTEVYLQLINRQI
ncbi:MAG: primosomal protein N', partial [Gammaproteobacteria bacterium]|nr:primosomal protein N' [Gammaproteobacteria bacterium]